MAVDINNLGIFVSIDAVWMAYPEGGHEGDYLTIAGVKHRWNKYLRIWENASTVTTSAARLVTSVGGDLVVNNDSIIGDELKVRGDTYLEGDVKVEGMLDAKAVKQPNRGSFQTAQALQDVYPNPEVGWWATVGDSMPGIIYRCQTKGVWTNTGKTGGIDPERVYFEIEDSLNSISTEKALSAHQGKILGEQKADYGAIGTTPAITTWNRNHQIGADGTHNSGEGWSNWYISDDIHLSQGQTIVCYVSSTGNGRFAPISIHSGSLYIPVVVKQFIGANLTCKVQYTALSSCNVVICTAPLNNPLPVPLIMNDAKTLGDTDNSPLCKQMIFMGLDSTRINQYFVGRKDHTYSLVFDNIDEWTVDNIGSGNTCCLLGTDSEHEQSYIPIKQLHYTCKEDNQTINIYFRADSGCMIKSSLYDVTPVITEMGGLVITDRIETLNGKNNTYVYLSKLNDMLKQGHDYIYIPNKSTWPVAQNTLSYNVFGFNISYYIGNERTDLFTSKILSGQSVLESELPEKISFHMPNVQWDRTEFGFRAIDGEEVGGELIDVTSVITEMGGLVITDRIETLNGKNNTYVYLSKLNDMLKQGHDYIYIPNKSTWPVAQNTLSYNVFGFNISYYVGNVRTNLFASRILSGQSVLESELPEKISFHMPNVQWDRTEFGFRAIDGEEVGGELIDVTYSSSNGSGGGAGIHDLFPETHYLPKVATLKKKTPYGYSPVNNPLVLLWFSDIHGNLTNFERILQWKNKYASYIDGILNTGDTITDNLATYNSDITPYFNSGGNRVMHVIGNHDVTPANQSYKGWSGNEITIKDVYDRFTALMDFQSLGIIQPNNAAINGYNFYYKDFAGFGKSSAGIRLIVLDSSLKVTNITASGSGVSTDATEAYELAQRQWFDETLESARQLGYSVVCATHYATRVDEFDSDSGFVAYNKNLSPAEDNRFQDYFLQAVDSFKSNGGDFVAWLVGHVHTDHIGVSSTYNDQLVIAVTTATPRLYTAESNEPARIDNTTTQDAFNLIEIDTYYKQIKMLRVGYGFDAYGRIIDMISIDYNRCKLLR